ncbi:MAG: hypothetical protein EOP49_05450 [Sphingobacteriales bacterium]|nr:MAG: hypothetical protein EOP49_05450 [Sphingobacteriales bacterium]
MKIKFLLLLSFLSVSIIASAQIHKGAVMIGGYLSYSTHKSETNDTKTHAFNISPGAGIAVRDNLILGVDVLYHNALSDYGQGSKNEMNGFGGGVFLRKYAVIAKKFYLFGQGRIGTTFFDEEQNSISNAYKVKTTNINLSAYPGVAYSITPKLLLEAGFPDLLYAGYTSRKVTGTSNDKTTGFQVATSLSSGTPLSIGMRVLLNRR